MDQHIIDQFGAFSCTEQTEMDQTKETNRMKKQMEARMAKGGVSNPF